MDKKVLETIPLIIYENSPGKILAYIEIDLGNHITRFLFDTGAAKSQLKLDSVTENFNRVGQKESKGASGVGLEQDLVEVPKLIFGESVFENLELARSHRSILGIDLLGKKKFEIDLKSGVLSFVDQIENKEKINWLKKGHLTIPLVVDSDSTYCLFDTGADSTVIDEQYVTKNPNSFELIGTEEGEDAYGNKIPSNIYHCRNLQIGHLDLKNVVMAGFEFGDHMREAMEGVPIILGNNVINGSIWSFDFENGFWSSCSNL